MELETRPCHWPMQSFRFDYGFHCIHSLNKTVYSSRFRRRLDKKTPLSNCRSVASKNQRIAPVLFDDALGDLGVALRYFDTQSRRDLGIDNEVTFATFNDRNASSGRTIKNLQSRIGRPLPMLLG